jgi:Type IV secretion-system coupling protein DNA-binding domain
VRHYAGGDGLSFWKKEQAAPPLRLAAWVVPSAPTTVGGTAPDGNGTVACTVQLKETFFHRLSTPTDCPLGKMAPARRGGQPMDEHQRDRPYILGATQHGSALPLSRVQVRNHIYITGKSGTGKSSLLFNLAQTDMLAGRGLLFIDPHGDTARALADATPPCRRADVVYFDPLDETHVVGFNPLMTVPLLHRGTLAARIVEAFHNIWADSWGPRLDYTLTNAIRLLLENPGSSLVDIPKLLVEDKFRAKLLRKCRDGYIRDYWLKEYGSYSDKLRAEVIAPIQNKIGQFANNPILRDIVGGRSTIDPKKIMDEGKVLICNLSKRMGEEPSRLLGALLVTAFAQAAEARAEIPEDDRKDFTLYVDEFQSFANDAFATMLSESRKYRLALVTSNQFLGQLPEQLRYAIIGNVGTIIAFRVGAFDAPLLASELGMPEDALINLPNFTARIKWLDHGSPTEAIYVQMYEPRPHMTGRFECVRAQSRHRHSRPRRRY